MQSTTTTFHDLPSDLVKLATDMAPALTFTCRALLPFLTEEKRYQMLIDNGGDIQFCRKRGDLGVRIVPQVVWTFNNKPHRRNGPAIQYTDGNVWYIHGQAHRLDGPASEFEYRCQWLVNGKLHRLDGPAEEDCYGNKAWYFEDKLHRLDGPAIERADGTKQWWIAGKQVGGSQSWNL